MKFCVRYRTKEGQLTSMTVEAENRNGVFEELSRRGISAVSVSEGEAKPVKRASFRKPGGSRSSLLGWGIGIAALLAIGIGVYVFMHGNTPQDGEGDAKRSRQIALHSPPKRRNSPKGNALARFRARKGIRLLAKGERTASVNGHLPTPAPRCTS